MVTFVPRKSFWLMNTWTPMRFFVHELFDHIYIHQEIRLFQNRHSHVSMEHHHVDFGSHFPHKNHWSQRRVRLGFCVQKCLHLSHPPWPCVTTLQTNCPRQVWEIGSVIPLDWVWAMRLNVRLEKWAWAMETYRQRRCGKGGGDSGHVFSAGMCRPQLIRCWWKACKFTWRKLSLPSCCRFLMGSFSRSYGQHPMVPSSTHGGWYYIYSASDSSIFWYSYCCTMFLVVLVVWCCVCVDHTMGQRTRNLEHAPIYHKHSMIHQHLGHFCGGERLYQPSTISKLYTPAI